MSIRRCGFNVLQSSRQPPRHRHQMMLPLPSLLRRQHGTSQWSRIPTLSLNNENADHNHHADTTGNIRSQISVSFSDASKVFCRLSPIWTLLSAGIAINYSSSVGTTIGSLPVMQTSLAILMLAMGLTITPSDISCATQKPSIIILNILLCFGMMPMLALTIASFLNMVPDYNAGLILLGSVSGGQASNLFALLAGGDVALSVACTVSTTLLGTIAIPLLVKWLLNCIVVVDFMGVLKSVSQLVLLPLTLGLSLGRIRPSLVARLESVCPLIGVIATLVLVAGGASNCAFASIGSNRSEYYTIMLASYLLPILGGIVAWVASYLSIKMEETSRRTLVVETLSKSPTLAFVLAKTHFGEKAAAIPAGGMVSLAVVGAAVASIWAAISPIENHQTSNGSKVV